MTRQQVSVWDGEDNLETRDMKSLVTWLDREGTAALSPSSVCPVAPPRVMC